MTRWEVRIYIKEDDRFPFIVYHPSNTEHLEKFVKLFSNDVIMKIIPPKKEEDENNLLKYGESLK